MKKTSFVLACLLALSACSEQSDAPQNSTNNTPAVAASSAKAAPVATATKKAEHYIVGTDASYPPFDFKDDSGQIAGFDVDILRAIGEDQGFSVDFISTERSQLFPSLKDGQYQILAACLGMSAERLAQSEMSVPYAFAPNVIMGKAGGTEPQTLADLGSKKVVTQEGSYTYDALKAANVPNVSTTNSLYNAYSTFVRGEADYVLGDAGVLSYHHKNNQEANKPKVYTAVYDKSEDVRVGFAVQKGNTALIGKINEGLKNIRANGKYDEIYAKWFGDDLTLRVPEAK